MSRSGTRRPRAPLPKHPFRDSAIMYGVLAAVVVGVTILTGGGAVRGFLVAAIFFVVATTWTWWRFRMRLAQDRAPRR